MSRMAILSIVIAAFTGVQPGGHVLAVMCPCPSEAAESEPIVRQGDWTIEGKETYRDQHIQLNGTLILPEGTELVLERCTLEITGDYSREHSVEWKGGSLVTRNCTIGGFVNPSGTAIHTVFHLYDGNWEATDTIVQYSYGISFHWSKGHGVLRGTRLIAGPRPDAIILSGEADVKLVDSDFPIGLGLYVDKGGADDPGSRARQANHGNLRSGQPVAWRELETPDAQYKRETLVCLYSQYRYAS